MKKSLLAGAGLLLIAALVLGFLTLQGIRPSKKDYQLDSPLDAAPTLVLAERVSACRYQVEKTPERQNFILPDFQRVASSDWRVVRVYAGDPLLEGQTITIREVQGYTDSARQAGQGWRYHRAALAKQERIVVQLGMDAGERSGGLRFFAAVEEDGTVKSKTPTTLDALEQAVWPRDTFYLRWDGALYRYDGPYYGMPSYADYQQIETSLTYSDTDVPTEDGACNWPDAGQVLSICLSKNATHLFTTSFEKPYEVPFGTAAWERWVRVEQD